MYEPAPQIKVFWAILNGVVVPINRSSGSGINTGNYSIVCVRVHGIFRIIRTEIVIHIFDVPGQKVYAVDSRSIFIVYGCSAAKKLALCESIMITGF